MYGLPHLVDAHDTVLISPTLHAKKRGSTFEPAFVRKQLEPGELWQMECRDELITVAAPPVAVVQALQLIRSRQCAWPVIASEDDEVFVRAVQLVDASRRFLALTPETIAVAGKGRVNNRWLASVLKLEEQVEFWANGKLVTRADLAFPEARIALYYDGRHHDDASTRLRDTSIDLYLTSTNWRPLRYGTNMLSGLVGHLEVVLRERGFTKVDEPKI